MIKLKLKGLGTFDLVSSWEEVTVDQHLKMQYSWHDKDALRLLAILIGQPYEKVFESGEDPNKVRMVLSSILAGPPDMDEMKKACPPVYTLGGIVCKIKPIAKQTLGQKIYLEQLGMSIKGKPDEMPKLIPAVCAVYLAPQYYGTATFNAEQAEELTALILKQPIAKIYPIAYFFLKHGRHSIMNGMKDLTRHTRRKLARTKLLERAQGLMSLRK